MSKINSLNLKISPQPTSSTCGPTCLSSIYNFWNDDIELAQVISEISELPGGGTLGVQLGTHALERGYKVKIYSHNLRVFDPTWFALSNDQKISKLHLQAKIKSHKSKLSAASLLYAEYLEKGGEILFEGLTPEFLNRFLSVGKPLITGLSSTYLYKTPREYGDDCEYDDLKGDPQGHFVVITGISPDLKSVSIADPHEDHPGSEGQHYKVQVQELIGAILIGVITYDANLILIEKETTK